MYLPDSWVTRGVAHAPDKHKNEVELITGDHLRPMQNVSVIRYQEDCFETVPMLWGLIPSWVKDASIAKYTIKARAETVAEKPAFQSCFKDKRAVVPATGFYEWRRTIVANAPKNATISH